MGLKLFCEEIKEYEERERNLSKIFLKRKYLVDKRIEIRSRRLFLRLFYEEINEYQERKISKDIF